MFCTALNLSSHQTAPYCHPCGLADCRRATEKGPFGRNPYWPPCRCRRSRFSRRRMLGLPSNLPCSTSGEAVSRSNMHSLLGNLGGKPARVPRSPRPYCARTPRQVLASIPAQVPADGRGRGYRPRQQHPRFRRPQLTASCILPTTCGRRSFQCSALGRIRVTRVIPG